MSVYVIFHYNILSRDRIDELGPRALPIVERFGGELVVGSYVTHLEPSPYSHMVVYKFPDEASAKAFYASDEHRELSVLRKEITEGFAVCVPHYQEKSVVP